MSKPSALPPFGELPMPPIEILSIEVVPECHTPAHVPAGFVLMEDQIHRTYLVPAFMVETLKSAARGNTLSEAIVEEEVEVCHLIFPFAPS